MTHGTDQLNYINYIILWSENWWLRTIAFWSYSRIGIFSKESRSKMTVWLAIKVIDVSKRYKTARLRDLSTSLIMASCPWLMESKVASYIFLRSVWLYFLVKSRQSWIYNTCVWRFRISKCKMVRSTYDGKKSFEEPFKQFRY